ncbi:phosphoribosyl-ATP diphosphatase [Candidatus Gottesmanbacteria bacterium]|nr:phosphoribosyl-ATP diphosphatase [Candidatus Gottesmanbacteria bacterium]
MKLEELYSIIKDRQKKKPKGSYIVSLFKEGNDLVIQKVGEEAVEVIIASKGKNKSRIVEEIADLYFMTLILMVSKDVTLDMILGELDKRRK